MLPVSVEVRDVLIGLEYRGWVRTHRWRRSRQRCRRQSPWLVAGIERSAEGDYSGGVADRGGEDSGF